MSNWPEYKTADRLSPVERYIEMCWAHNIEADWDKRYEITQYAYGYKQALNDLGYHGPHLLTEADQYFLDLGIDRPMCGGILLDIEKNGVLDRITLTKGKAA